jgi:hypothetical protein
MKSWDCTELYRISKMGLNFTRRLFFKEDECKMKFFDHKFSMEFGVGKRDGDSREVNDGIKLEKYPNFKFLKGIFEVVPHKL